MCYKGDQLVEECLVDPSSGQHAICGALFDKKQHSSYWSSQFDFFLFPKVKSALKGMRFESMDTVNAEAIELPHTIPL